MQSDSIPFIRPIDAVNAITFDCDGTLSKIEGIDYLAQLNDVGEPVQNLTERAMTKTGLNPMLYEQRLQLVHPTKAQLLDLGNQYFLNKTQDALEVISLFQTLKKEVFILSAGLYPAIVGFGKQLGIPKKNIFAVHVMFDANSHFLDFDRKSPLITDQGKQIMGAKLKEVYPRIIHIGDGLNDCSIRDLVVRFIGYGGVFYRETIAKLAHHYVACESMAAILPFCLTLEEVNLLTLPHLALYQKGLGLVEAAF